jgi:hypothetical protein
VVGVFSFALEASMSFVDARNSRGEVQTVPEHFLAEFPDQFKPLEPEKASQPAKAEKPKES